MASNNDEIDILKREINELKKRISALEKPTKKPTPKNIEFEKAFELCEEGIAYPCMYLPKSGKQKNKCCGIEATLVDNEDSTEQINIDGKVSKELFHSLRCEACKNKGRANSESKRKCTEKIRGINVDNPSEVNQKVLSFLSGNNDGILSPTRALSSNSTLEGDEIEHEDYYHYIVPLDGNSFIFERSKNKNGKPSIKKTPTLRGFIDKEEIDKEDYLSEINDKIPEKIYNNVKNKHKFKFEGIIIKPEVKEPVVPQLKMTEEKEDDNIADDEMDEILNGLNIE